MIPSFDEPVVVVWVDEMCNIHDLLNVLLCCTHYKTIYVHTSLNEYAYFIFSPIW